jgi:hypothetical protein
MLDFNLVTKIFQYKLENLYKKMNKSRQGRVMGSGTGKKNPPRGTGGDIFNP